jgi:flagellar export protein FliJ
MKPFHFSLQAVRTLRQREEQFALELFGRAVQARQRALEFQQAAERQLAAARQQLREMMGEGGGRKPAPVFQINQARGHCQGLEQRVAACKVETARAQEAANEAWDRLQDARRQLELVDKLYLRRREEHDRQLRAEEQKLLDEMAGRTRPGQCKIMNWEIETGAPSPAAFACN